MEFVTFKRFVSLVPEAGLQRKTLKEQSLIIFGTESKYSIISKVNTSRPIGHGQNYRDLNSFMNKFGYSLELTAPKDVDDSIKDKRIKELEEELTYYKSLCACYINKLEAYRQVEEALKLLNEVTEEECLCKRPRHNRKRGNK